MTFTPAKSNLETPEQCMKCVQRYEYRQENDVNDIVPVSFLFTLNRFHTLL